MIRLDAPQVDELLLAAMRHEVHLHVVEGGRDRESSYDAFAASLELPEYFGRNLDALMDCLRDVADRHDGRWFLLWQPVRSEELDRAEDPGVLGVLTDLEDEYPGLTVAVA